MKALSIIEEMPEIQKNLDSLSYLVELSEDMIFRNFLTVWPNYAPLSQAPLSTDDKLTLLDLRIRSLNARMQKDPQVDSIPLLPPDVS